MGKKLTNLFFTLVALFCFASANAQEISDPQVVLDEHFDAFTEGSTDAPTTKDISGYSGKLKTELGWTSGRYVYEAGGSLMVGDGGNLQTSYLNLSSNGGTVRITVDIKMRDSYGGGVKVSMGYSANETKYCTDSEWHTYSFIFSGGTSSAYVKVEPVMCASGILVDNLKVETGTGFIAAPKVQQPTKATKTSFTASWIGVKGATGYLLDVYSKNGSEKEYLLKDQAVTGSYTSAYMPNTYDVTGLDETKTYFYTMRTVKDENVSEESEEIEVIPVITSVDTPVATEATDVTAAGFTANWEAVADASGYSVKVTRNSVLAEDGDVSILSEDFSGVTKGSLTSVEYPSTRESLDAYTSTKGWEGYMHCLAAGYMGISTYGSEGTITTPKLDLSANDGKFTLKLNAGANYYGTMKADECKVVVIDKAGNKAETTVSLEAAFKEYVLDLTGGDDATSIQIAYGGSNKFFIDEMSIVQTLKAGSVKSDVVDLSDVGNVTSKTYELPLDANTSYKYQVAAYVHTIVSGEPGDVYSAYSEPVTVEAATPAGTLTADPKEINFWGFTPATDNYYYNTHKAIFHVEAENLTENIKFVMKSNGKATGSTSPKVKVATSGLYENRSGNLNVTCSSSKAADISDVVVISSGDVTEEVTVNVKVVNTQYNGEGIFDEEWDEYRPFTMADLNSIHTIMPKNTTFGTDPTHEFSMYFPKLRYFQGVVSAVAADADGKVTFTLADAEGDATVKVVEALYKEGQTALKTGDKVILSGDFGDVEGELQILTATIEEITADTPADGTVYGTYAAPVALEDGKTYGMNADKTGGQFNYYTFESAEDVKITLTTTPGSNPGGGFGVMTGNFMFDDQYNDLEGYVMLGEDDLTTEMVPVGGEEGGIGGDDDFGVGFGSFVISTSWNAKAGEKYYIMCQGAGTFTVALSEAETGEKVGTMTNPINLNETPTWTWGVDGKVPGSATYYTYKAEKAGELTITNGNEEIFVGEDGWYDGFVNTSGPAYTGEIKKETNWADYTAAYTFAVEEGVTYCITIFDLTKGNDGEVIKAEFVEASDELPIGTFAAPIALEDGKTYGLNAAETGAPNFYTFESDEDVKIILTPTEGTIVEGGFGVSTGNFLMDDQYNDLEDAVYFEGVEAEPVGGDEPGIGGDDDFFDGGSMGFGRMAYTWTAKAGVKYYIMAMGQGAFTVELAEAVDDSEKVGTIENPVNLNETAEWTWGVDGKRPGSATHYTFTAEKDGQLAISTSADTELHIGVDGWWDPYYQTEGPKYDGEVKTSDYNLTTYTATYTFDVEEGSTYCITIFDLAGDVVKAEFTEATGIKGAAADKANGNVYNIRGQKVDGNTFRGIMIKNGVKVLKK